MRNTYQIVNRLAEQTRTAIVGLAHTRKAGAEDIMEAIMGSSEQGNVARSVHGLIMDSAEDGTRMLSCEKLNNKDKTTLPTLRFRLTNVYVDCTDGSGDVTPQPKVEWLAETTDTVSDVLSDQFHGLTGIDQCAQWLNTYLLSVGGEAYRSDVEEAAGRKFNMKMLERARKRLGVQSIREAREHGRAVWTHPENRIPGAP
jgi:hypothetical protein